MTSPAMAAAQQTTAPMMTAAAGPFWAPTRIPATKTALHHSHRPVPFGPPISIAPISRHSNNAETRTVEMVTPEIGLFDEPTRPAMYPATAAKRKPVSSMTSAITREIGICWTKCW